MGINLSIQIYIMKKIFVLLFLDITLSLTTSAQTCCSVKSSKNEFGNLICRQDFKDAHQEPAQLEYKAETGKMITFSTSDGKNGNAFYVSCGKKTKKIVIMLHEWWGLNDYIKREAERLQKSLGYVDVYAIDLYDGQVASDRETAAKLMGGMSPERAMNIAKGLISYVGAEAEIATIGWCMGGSWSYQTAIAAKSQTKACVMYYGFPDKDVEKMKILNSDIYFIQGTKDSFIKNEDIDAFAKNLESVGKKITVKKYKADHAFANPSNPKYSKEFSEDAYKLVVDYLKKGLKL